MRSRRYEAEIEDSAGDETDDATIARLDAALSTLRLAEGVTEAYVQVTPQMLYEPDDPQYSTSRQRYHYGGK